MLRMYREIQLVAEVKVSQAERVARAREEPLTLGNTAPGQEQRSQGYTSSMERKREK